MASARALTGGGTMPISREGIPLESRAGPASKPRGDREGGGASHHFLTVAARIKTSKNPPYCLTWQFGGINSTSRT